MESRKLQKKKAIEKKDGVWNRVKLPEATQRSKGKENWTLENNPGSLEQIGLVIKRVIKDARGIIQEARN